MEPSRAIGSACVPRSTIRPPLSAAALLLTVDTKVPYNFDS